MGDTIHFSGHATDDEDGALTGGDLDWKILMVHCPGGCHTHTIETDSGGSGSFSAPDHEYPSHLVIRLTATDSDGGKTSVDVDLEPKTATIDLASSPSGVPADRRARRASSAPWTATVIKGGESTISGPLSRTIGGERFRFSTWNDSHKRVREVTAAHDLDLTATYVPDAPDSCKSISERSPTGAAIAERSSGNGDTDWFEFHVAEQARRAREARRPARQGQARPLPLVHQPAWPRRTTPASRPSRSSGRSRRAPTGSG